MSYNLAPIPLTVGVTSPITIPGDLGAVTWVKITNASPYLVQLTNILSGQDYLQPGEANVWPVPGLTTAIQATPIQFATAPSLVPVSSLVVTWYQTGEEPSGNYPVNFNLLSYTGNTLVSAAEVINDDYSLGTNVVEATPQGATASYLLARNDGTFDVQAISNGTLTDILHVTPGTSGTPAQLVLQLLKTLGVVSLDGGLITTNGGGTLTINPGVLDIHTNGNSQIPGMNMLNGTTQLILRSEANTTFGIVADPAGSGLATQLNFVVSNGVQSTTVLELIGSVAAGGPATLIPVLLLNIPPLMVSGHQGSGPCSSAFTATAALQRLSITVPFPMSMTNLPTSVTLNGSGTNLAAGFPAVGSITNQGFLFTIESAAAGLCSWTGTYTTVGN